jgi:hypothetical protein
MVMGGWDGVVDVATNDGLDKPGIESRQRQEIFSLLQISHTGSENHPASYSMGIGVLSQG